MSKLKGLSKMNNPTPQEDYGMSVDQAQLIIAEGAKVDRLMQNKDFIDIMMEGFIRQSALNKVSLLSVPEMAQHRDNIIKELDAISIVDAFLRNIQSTANQTKLSLSEFEEEQRLEQEQETEVV
jgi:hypothetical protein